MSDPTLKQAKKIAQTLKKMGVGIDDEPIPKDVEKAEERAEESSWFQEQPEAKQPDILKSWIKQEAILRALIKRGVTQTSASKAIAYGEELLEQYDWKSLGNKDRKNIADDFVASIFSAPPAREEDEDDGNSNKLSKKDILKKLGEKYSKEELLAFLSD